MKEMTIVIVIVIAIVIVVEEHYFALQETDWGLQASTSNSIGGINRKHFVCTVHCALCRHADMSAIYSLLQAKAAICLSWLAR